MPSSPSGLKPPLFHDNEYEPPGICAIGPEFFALVTVTPSTSRVSLGSPSPPGAGGAMGWQWLDEGKVGRPKWGFVTYEVGAKLTVELDMKREFAKMTVRQEKDSSRSGGAGGSNKVHLGAVTKRCAF